MHVTEELEALWQLICRHHNVRLLDEVGPQVDVLHTKYALDVLHVLNLPLRGVEIRTKMLPGQNVLRLGGKLVIALTSEAK